MWMRWNDTTHIFEMSTNDGASWAVLPLNASVINEGSLNPSRLPANVALKDANNNFTASQTINGTLIVNTLGNNFIQGNGSNISLLVVNNSAVASNYSQFAVGNNTNAALAFIRAWSSTTPVTSGYNQADAAIFASSGAGGLHISADGGFIKLWTGPTLRMTIDINGLVMVNTPTASGQMNLGFAGQTTPGFWIQNTNPAFGGTLIYFVNNTFGGAGSIIQSTATSVVYGTTSDARLKIDKGIAIDLSSLRSLIIHDFEWKTDKIVDRGVFAQEAHKIFPRAIVIGDDEETEDGGLKHPWMTDYSKFVPDLIAGWQEHDKEIAELKRLLNDKSLS